MVIGHKSESRMIIIGLFSKRGKRPKETPSSKGSFAKKHERSFKMSPLFLFK